MIKKLALIHTASTLIPVFDKLIWNKLKGKNMEVFNMLDESLIKNTIKLNRLSTDTTRRVVNYVVSAEEAGADFILVTCSSIGPAVEIAAQLIQVPVLRVDQPMADKSVELGSKIGVVATLETTLQPTSDLVIRRAKLAERDINITTKLCEGAFEALMHGNQAYHDKIVSEAIKELAGQVDVIVLAQASMARIISSIKADINTPILSSPKIAIDYLAQIL